MRKRTLHLLAVFILGGLLAGFIAGCSDGGDDDDGDSLYEKAISGDTLDIIFVEYPPYVMVENGQITGGLSIVLMDTMASRLGINVDYRLVDGYEAAVETIQNREADLFAGPIWPASERATKAAFTNPIMLTEIAFYKQENNNDYQSVDDIDSNTRISFVEGDYPSHYIKGVWSNTQHVALAAGNPERAAAEAVANGQSDIAVLEKSLVYEVYGNLGLEELATAFTIGVRMIHPHGEHDFNSMINVAIDEMVEIDIVDSLIVDFLSECGGCVRSPR